MKTYILFFISFIPVVCFSQQDKALLGFLLMYKGSPSKSVNTYSHPDTFTGYIAYNNQRVEGEFNIKNNFIVSDKDSIYLGDKELRYIELRNQNEVIKIERTDNDNLLKRVVADTLDFKIYSSFNLEKGYKKRNLFFKYKGEYYFVRKSIFRKIDENICKTLEKIEFDDPKIKSYVVRMLHLQ